MAEELTESQIEQQALAEVRTLLQEATMLIIQTPEQAQRAADFRNLVHERRQRIEAWFKPLVDAAHKAHKALTLKRAAVLEPYNQPLRLLDQKLAAYNIECKRKEREAAAAAEAERQRLVEEHRLAAALKAEQGGHHEQADRILEGHAPEPVIVVPLTEAPVPKVQGVAFVETWHAEVLDLATLIEAVAAGKAALELIEPNLPRLNQLARALGNAFAVPGCRAVLDTRTRRTT